MDGIVTPGTIWRGYRERVAPKHDGNDRRRLGRPPVGHEHSQLHLPNGLGTTTKSGVTQSTRFQDDEDNSMRLVNRQAAIVYLRQPFVDWINETERRTGGTTRFTIEEANQEPNVYLLEQYDLPEDNLSYLEEFSAAIFEAELSGWYTDPEMWPQNPSSEVFSKWLKVDLLSMVIDLESGRLKKGERFP